MDVPRDVGIVGAHDPAGRGTQELAPPAAAPGRVPVQPTGGTAMALPDELLGHFPAVVPAASPALPACGFLLAAGETAQMTAGGGRRHRCPVGRPAARRGPHLPAHGGERPPSGTCHRAPRRQLLPERQISDRRRQGEARRRWGEGCAPAHRGAALRPGGHAGKGRRTGRAPPAHRHGAAPGAGSDAAAGSVTSAGSVAGAGGVSVQAALPVTATAQVAPPVASPLQAGPGRSARPRPPSPPALPSAPPWQRAARRGRTWRPGWRPGPGPGPRPPAPTWRHRRPTRNGAAAAARLATPTPGHAPRASPLAGSGSPRPRGRQRGRSCGAARGRSSSAQGRSSGVVREQCMLPRDTGPCTRSYSHARCSVLCPNWPRGASRRCRGGSPRNPCHEPIAAGGRPLPASPGTWLSAGRLPAFPGGGVSLQLGKSFAGRPGFAGRAEAAAPSNR